MPKRTLRASPKGIEKAKYALLRKNWTQQSLAHDIQVASWATISKFFNSVAISYNLFLEICTILELDWQEIAILPSPDTTETQNQQLSSFEKIWRQLQELGSLSEQMGLVLVEEETLGWGWETNSRYETSVSIGSYIQFEVNFDTPGYLVLIQKDTSGQVWCFCPSCFAPQPHLNTGKTSLPQQGSPITSFPIEGKPGKEVVLAVITEQMPVLNWLPTGDSRPLQLTENHLYELINFVSITESCRVMYTEYEVI